jgi:predicted enzyme related to lactoylglutathione lyase
MKAKLSYVIKFVTDMDRAVAFYRDTFGLKVKFATPEWSEFDTGEVKLALHLTTDETKAGTTQVGFSAPDVAVTYAEREALGLNFTQEPFLEHGTLLSRLLDCEGAEVSLSGKP